MVRLLVVVGLLTIGISVASGGDSSAVQTISLPRNASTPVIVLDFDDNLAAAQQLNDLYLAIYSDGQAVVSVAGDRGRHLSGRIPANELRTLLDELLTQNRLLDCRTSELQQNIRSARQARQRPEPGRDAATTVIRVRTGDASHEIRCHALGLTASQLPELADVRRLYTCQQRLENVAAIIRAGGYENVNAVLSAANKSLRQQAPQTESLGTRDLSLVDLRPDGTRYLQFSRIPDIDGLRPAGGYVMVSVYQAPGREPEITVTADAS